MAEMYYLASEWLANQRQARPKEIIKAYYSNAIQLLDTASSNSGGEDNNMVVDIMFSLAKYADSQLELISRDITENNKILDLVLKEKKREMEGLIAELSSITVNININPSNIGGKNDANVSSKVIAAKAANLKRRIDKLRQQIIYGTLQGT
ncbi:hypothetical protein AX774_g5678 [Zancudomyces culisetae]|uniref:Uncharacterized protein n=1 Tax=Zancudomyces culisetae TaxID=1213189 RepID=A0A1R1PIR5_ZANCU|nr:hypothetical protein AX774_g5678 [Zancudomyces culisetae]|eukprot:OMH80874.1 hypothetical protein AX774_g5678 [Zancudomyces culisetae]